MVHPWLAESRRLKLWVACVHRTAALRALPPDAELAAMMHGADLPALDRAWRELKAEGRLEVMVPPTGGRRVRVLINDAWSAWTPPTGVRVPVAAE
jgi:hypothetical protein